MAETFGELLDKRKRTAVAIFHRFRLEVAAGLQHAIFVEGFEDQAFYCRFLPIGAFRRDSVRLAFGKRNMDRLISMYYAESLDERCDARFVRDADFDDYLGTLPVGDRVLVLDRYSVENYIYSPENLQRLIAERFGVAPDEYDLVECVHRYEQAVGEIFLHLAPLLGAALAAMQEGTTLNLDGLDIRALAAEFFATGQCRALTDEDFERCTIPLHLKSEETAAVGADFVSRQPLLWMRGHYLALICSAFVQRTHDSLCAAKAAGALHTLNPNLSIDFSAPALSERMGSFCNAPEVMLALAA